MFRNIFCALALVFTLVNFSLAQIPRYRFSKFDTTGQQTSSNAFANNGEPIKYQSIYYPSNFPAMPAGMIKALYFRIGNNGTGTTSSTYPQFTAKIGYTTDSFFRFNGMNAYDTFKTGLTTVFGPATLTVTGTDSIGKWVRVPLTTPFYYTKEQKFVVEFTANHKARTGGFDIMTTNRAPFYNPHRNRNLGGHRDSIRVYYGSANIFIMDLGFDLTPNSVQDAPSLFSSYGLFPNPSTDGRFNVSFEMARPVSSTSVTVLNAAGQQVYHKSYEAGGQRFFREVSLGNIARGIYSVRVDAGGESFSQQLIVR